MDDAEARDRLLTAAGELFYARGIGAVGMDDIRASSGLALRRIYQHFGSKDSLVEAYLARRDERWMAALAGRVDQCRGPRRRVLAVFDFLADWFASPDFRGCAFINAFGEGGGGPGPVADITRRHKEGLARYLAGLAREARAPDPQPLAAQLLMLVDGAIVSAATGVNTRAAGDAREAAAALLAARGLTAE